MTYLLFFISSLFFLYLSVHAKRFKFVFSAFSIISLCILAAFRDSTIGTDVNVYVEPLLKGSLRYNSFHDFISVVYNIKDYGYLFITYICGKVSSESYFLFFINQLLIVVPIFMALIKKYSYSNKTIFGWSLFLLLFFNQSFNMVRQSIAISFTILAFSFIDDKKKYKFFLFALIAYLFHSSSIIIIPIYFIYQMLMNDKISNSKKNIIKLIILIPLFLFIFFLPKLLLFFNTHGIVSNSKYNIYAVKYLRNNLDFPVVRSLLYFITTFSIMITAKNNDVDKTKYKTALFFGILSIILLNFCATIKFAERISYYIYYPLVILFIPSIFNKKNNNIFWGFVYLLINFAYWIYWVVIYNYDATYPFIFR